MSGLHWKEQRTLRALPYQVVRSLHHRWQRRGFARRSRKAASRLVGLPIDRAIDQAGSLGYKVREVSPRTGVTYLTFDFQPFRITLWADEQGTVFRSEWG